MSYQVNLIKDADGIRVESTSGLSNLPDGHVTINGHHPTEGTSQVGTVHVTVTDATRNLIGGASGQYRTTPTA